jgi:hypothetical protein
LRVIKQTIYYVHLYHLYAIYLHCFTNAKRPIGQLAVRQSIPISSKATEPKDWDFPFHFNGPRSSTSVIESQNQQLSFRK